MSAKKAGANAGVVDELRDDIAHTREGLGESVSTLADRAEGIGESARRHPVRWGSLAAGVLAAVAAVVTVRWRRSRQPRNRAEQVWRDVRSKARDASKDLKSKARDASKDVKGRARGVKKDAKRAARQMKGRLGR